LFRCKQWIDFCDESKLNEVKGEMYSSYYKICSMHFNNVNIPSIIEDGTNMYVNAEYNRQSSSFLSIDESCATESQPLDLSCTSRYSSNLKSSKFPIGIQYLQYFFNL